MAVACASCGAKHDDWIPKDRLDTVIEQRKAAEDAAKAHLAKIGDLESDLTATRKTATAAEALAARIAEYERKESTWSAERALFAAGVKDDEGVQVVRTLWDALPADKRPASIGDWLGNRDTLPKAVRAYLPEATPAPVAVATPTPPQAAAVAPPAASSPAPVAPVVAAPAAPATPALPAANAGTSPPPPPASAYSAEAIRAMSPEQYRAHRDAIRAAVKAPAGS